MPLVHSEKIEEASTLLIWRLTETEDQLRKMLGSTYNSEDLDSITHPQKKREWLASRLLIKIISEEFGVVFAGTYKDDHGKVFLAKNDAQISITHTFDYVAAILNPTSAVGIDMEKLDPKLLRTATKYLNERELGHANNKIKNLGIYWCAKEAIYKQYGRTKISFKDNIEVLPFSSDEVLLSGLLETGTGKIQSKIFLRWLDDYCLAVAV